MFNQSFLPALFLLITFSLCSNCSSSEQTSAKENKPTTLRLVKDSINGTISVFRNSEKESILTQNAQVDFRPYLHPIVAPDGKGFATEYSPGHHKHQTGIYWGFTRVNGKNIPQEKVKKNFYRRDKSPELIAELGRDFFHHPEGDYWKRIDFKLLDTLGASVKWQTIYHMLDAAGKPILEESQTWTMQEKEGQFLLDLDWEGKAIEEVTINAFEYGGLFIRMPWKEGIDGAVVNGARQRNAQAEGQRAHWLDVGMQVEGREDLLHLIIFDHPKNGGFPTTWRVDGQMGVGPVRARMGDWTISKGSSELIQHRLIIYTGALNDVELNEQWNAYIGSNSLYSAASLWDLAQEEGRLAKFLSAEEAVAHSTIKNGFQVNAWASEPMITQPMAFCWDDKGRLWVAENRDYESRGYGFSNSGDSRILILEDMDRDGIADRRTVFLEGIPFPSAIAVGFGGLYLGAPPNLLFIPDKNGDDKAEMADIQVLLTGWGIRDRHETINSLHWGPDGWLYGLEGFATPSKIRKPKGKGKLYKHKEPFPEDLLEAEGVDINGGVWRYHPTKDKFEVVAHGFSNPWGIDYDAKGQLFITACVIPHLFHIIPGGIYHRQGGKHFNPYVYSDIRTIVNHRHRSAHGGARVYLSDAFPHEQYGRLFMANIHEHAVLSDILEPKGSGFVAHHGEDFMHANNAQWIGFSMELGPEGALYVLDWHDADICGKEVLNKETGRIFRITPEKSKAENWPGRYEDLSLKSDLELAQLQTSKSSWHARRARVILQYRASQKAISKEAIDFLKNTFESRLDVDQRLQALWTMHICKLLTEAKLLSSLEDQEEYVRAWAIQFLCEDGTPNQKILDRFAQMAKEDGSPVVHLYLAAALQRIDFEKRWEIAKGLLQQAQHTTDHNIPKMIWFAIEPLVYENSEGLLELANNSQIPIITEFIARRLVDADQVNLVVEALQKENPNRLFLMQGLQSGLEGRSDIQIPKNWQNVYAKLQKQKILAPLALELAQQFGDAEAAKTLMQQLKNKSTSVDNRKKAIKALAEQQWPELASEFPRLLQNSELRLEAIRAIAQYDNYDLGIQLLKQYNKLDPKEQQEVIQTLSSRSIYGNLLTDALEKEAISKKDIPAYVARQLRRVVGNGFVEIWGPIDQLSANKEAAYIKYRNLLQPEAIAQANVQQGKRIFQNTCAACHKMYGAGGNLGPDITGANRSNLEYLLSNILDPSGVIQDDYKMVVITTRNGRTFSGNITAETERQITLRTVAEEAVVLNKSEIQSKEQTEISMMPEGLLESLTDQEVLNLVAYLNTTEQLSINE